MLFRSDEGEEMCCRPPILYLRTANAQGHGLQLPLASVQRRNFSSDDHLDVWQAFDSLDQILRHRPAERPANDHGYLFGPAGKIDGGLARRISSTDQGNLTVGAEIRFERRGPIME